MLKVILLTLLPLALAVQCPDSFLIDPCTCKVEPEGPHLFCDYLPSLKSLTDIFSRRFPSGDALHQLTLTRSKLAPLPNDVFHGKSFQIIELSANRYISFDESKILSSSQKTLRSLSIDQDTEDWNFNFANVANFAALTDLRVSGYNLKFIGSASKMPILTGLSLKSYLMMAPPQLADLPALQALDLDGNTIQTLSQHDFASVPSLKQVFLGHNKLVKINTSSIALHGPMQVIDLSSNMIDDIQPDSISGNHPFAKCIAQVAQFFLCRHRCFDAAVPGEQQPAPAEQAGTGADRQAHVDGFGPIVR